MYQDNYQEVYKFLLEEAKNVFMEKIKEAIGLVL